MTATATGFVSDTDYLAQILADGEWHRLDHIISQSQHERGHGFTVHSRAADLRKRGHTVEQCCEHEGRRVHSFYRLTGSLGEPSSNQHAEHAHEGVPDGDGPPSETSDNVVSPSHTDGSPVSLSLFDDVAA